MMVEDIATVRVKNSKLIYFHFFYFYFLDLKLRISIILYVTVTYLLQVIVI